MARARGAGDRSRAQGRAAPRAREARQPHRRRVGDRSRRPRAYALGGGLPARARRRGPGRLRRPRRAPRRVAAVDRLPGAGRALRRSRALDEAVRSRRAEDPEGRARSQDALATARARGDPRPGDDRAGRAAAWSSSPRRSTGPRPRRAPSSTTSTSARAFFGAEGFLPAYYDDLDSLLAYVSPEDASSSSTIRPASRGRSATSSSGRRRDAAQKSGPSFLPGALYCDEAEVARELDARTVVALHRTAIVGAAGRRHQRLRVRRRAARSRVARPRRSDARGEGGARVAAARARRSRRSSGASPTGGARAARLHHGARRRRRPSASRRSCATRGSSARARLGAFDPAWLERDGPATSQIVVGPLARGVVLPADGLVLVTEEEIFGARAHRRRDARAGRGSRRALPRGSAQPLARRLRRARRARHRPLPGARPQGGRAASRSTSSRSSTRGGDKLYLPVWRLNQLEKYLGRRAAPRRSSTGSAAAPSRAPRPASRARCARWPTSSFACTPSARRSRAIALPAADDDYRAFEATLPVRRDGRPGARHRRREPRPRGRAARWTASSAATSASARRRSRCAPPSASAMAGTPGRAALPDDGARPAAPPDVRGADGRLPHHASARCRASRRKKEQEEALIGLKDGKVDVVVGTHRLLSKDVHFKDLGLLVVDEEQRFGVAHKERIKQLRAQVDVLTLTATPIPRTLQMAVTGMRDLSLITTRAGRPPRRAHDRHALGRPGRPRGGERELARGGQVLLRLQPRRQASTRRRSASRSSCPPRASRSRTGRWARPRSRRRCSTSSRAATTCSSSTAIIESGLDIPRANTMVIDRADLFGLAQLYQLRGRVGRSKERAYCYLVVPPANAHDRRGALAHRGARAAHRARERLPDRLARSRAARRRRSARRRAVGQRRERRLRPVLPDARRGRARAARRGGRARRRPRAVLRRRGAAPRGLRDRRRRAPVALQAPRERRPTRRT